MTHEPCSCGSCIECERNEYRDALRSAMMQFLSEQFGSETHDDGKSPHWNACYSECRSVLEKWRKFYEENRVVRYSIDPQAYRVLGYRLDQIDEAITFAKQHGWEPKSE